MKRTKVELYNDNFQNNLGNNAYGSNPSWYLGGDRKNGESKKAGKAFFNTDYNFNLAEYFHFCSKLLIKEPKERGKAPAMIVFCSFEQMPLVMKYGEKNGFKKSFPLIFIKKTSTQALKANMRIVGATEYALVLYRDKLPKFNNQNLAWNNGKKMVLNWFEWERDKVKEYPKIHPTQKPINVLKKLIEVFTDEGDVVIDPCAGSATTLRACMELNRSCYGFEIDKNFYKRAKEEMLVLPTDPQMSIEEFIK